MADCSENGENDILSVTTTVGTMDDAKRLARSLVEARLAACVQLETIAASFYRWDGKMCDEPEVRLTIKTARSRAAALEAFFVREHPYDVPQFVVMACAASHAYGSWVRAELA